MRRFHIVIISTLVSVILHLGMGLGLHYFPGSGFRPNLRQPSIVELVDFPSQNERKLKIQRLLDQQTYVRQAEVPKEEKTDIDLKARFFSERLQRVLLETQARLSGMTSNQKISPSQSHQVSNTNKVHKKPGVDTSKDFSPTGEVLAAAQRSLLERGYLARLEPSTVGERLPQDIRAANITALNTDAHQYYSFYSRLEELIRPRWVQFTQAAIERNPMRARQYTRKGELLCAYEFVLDHEGRFLRATALQLSGYEPFDQSIVLAFQAAYRIPNPPQDLIQSDGLVRIPLQVTATLSPYMASQEQ